MAQPVVPEWIGTGAGGGNFGVERFSETLTPGTLSVTDTTAGSVSLSCTAATDSFYGGSLTYQLQRRTGAGSWSNVGTP